MTKPGFRRVHNPPNPFEEARLEWDVDGELPPDAEVEVYEEETKTALAENDSPDVGFRWSINPYRGCYHACAYCLHGDTPVLMGDGTHRPIRSLRVGDEIYGTTFDGKYRRYVRTRVHAHWSTVKPAHRVVLDDGREIIASGDHRFLTHRGWKHVNGTEQGRACRAHLTTNDILLGPGPFAVQPTESDEIRVRRIDALGIELELFDITTGTGDFIANGVVSHNCYARSSHQYLGFGAGTDFERKIVVKTNIPERLRETFEKKSWKGETIAFSGNTDCYQPLEARYALTRRCLELCLEYRNPVGIITKSALIKRDVELIAALSREARCAVTLSIAWSDDADARKIEPTVTPPSVRFDVMRRLHEAGVPVSVGIAPVIPGLNDMQIPEILERARESGASHAFMMLIRLSGQTLPVFDERLGEAFPQRAQKVRNAILEMRGGKMNDTRFGARKVGRGERWRAIEQLFETHEKKLGYDERRSEPEETTFRRPRGQLELFS